MIDFVLAVMRMSTPLIFASMAGLFSERSGVVNIALEGFMLVGAFVGAVVAHYTGSPWLGWICAFVAGSLFSSIYGVFALKLVADQIVAGTAMNLLAIGCIPFATKILFNSTGSTPSLAMDARLSTEPLLVAALVVAFTIYVIRRTRWGLWILFAGEHPAALQSSGVRVERVRWMSVLLSGGLAAWGGATLSLALASSYSPLMTAGRGFIALAALIFGRWKPLPTVAACLFFGLTDAIQIRLQGSELGGVAVPVQFIQILPYVITLITLAGGLGRSRPPKALGKPL